MTDRIARSAAVLVIVLLGTAGPLLGRTSADQAAERPPGEAETPTPERKSVEIDGDVLFDVRGISAYPAERRAKDFESKIVGLARDPTVTSTSLTLEDQPHATWLVANGKRVLAVLDEDAALEDANRNVVAEARRRRTWDAIVAFRTARQPAVLWKHTLLALAATCGLALAAFACGRALRRLHAVLEQRYRTRFGDVHIQSFQFVKADQLWRALASVLRVAWAVAVVAMAFVYLQYVFGLFPWTRGTAIHLVDIAFEPMRTMALGVIRLIPDVVFLAVLYVIARAALRVLRTFFLSVYNRTVGLPNFDPDWAMPTYKLVRLLVIALAVVVAYPYIPGSNTDAFKSVSLFIGVVLSFGSSSFISNVLSGFSMTYRRMFRVGDHVQIGEHLGSIKEVRLLVTHLKTAKNEEVIVPNSTILNTEVVNYTRLAKPLGLILHTNVGIGYETPWRQVEAMLREAAARTPGLQRDRLPFVHLLKLGDFSVTYELNVYTDTAHRRRFLYSELHRNILDVFNEYGVQIMTPAYETDPKQQKVVPRERWYSEPASPPPEASSQDAVRSSPTRRH